jgi:predicted dehydrogenase
MKDTIRLAQVGCGYWGPNLLRAFSSAPRCHVKYVVDASEDRRRFVEQQFPRTQAIDDIRQVWQDPEIDAVVIATPAGSHFDLTKRSLEHGKAVFVEKPLATSVAEVDELHRTAEPRGLTVMVGHTFLFNNAVRHVQKMIAGGELGELRYIYSQRLNLGRIRSDIDALWNLAPHDVSIIQYWLGDPEPARVVRSGMDFVQPGIDDVVFLTITYPGKVLAQVHVSWLDPLKLRRMVVVGTKRMVVYDDVADDKIAVYDKGIDVRGVLGERMDFDAPPAQFLFSYRSGDVLLPKIDMVEPLRAEADHFLDCLRNGQEPLTNIAHARGVVGILEQAVRC